MSKYRSLILVISISVLFSGLVSAQERVQETRLLAKTGLVRALLATAGIVSTVRESRLRPYTSLIPTDDELRRF